MSREEERKFRSSRKSDKLSLLKKLMDSGKLLLPAVCPVGLQKRGVFRLDSPVRWEV